MSHFRLTGTARTFLCCMVLAAIAISLEFFRAVPARSGQTPPRQNQKDAAGHPDLMADIDDAIRLVEAGDFQTFLERYAPVEILRRMRQQDLVERSAALLAGRAESKAQLLSMLRAIKEQKPRYDRTRGLAVIDLAQPQPDVADDEDGLHPPDTKSLTLTSVRGDLPAVLSEAVRLLEESDVSQFVNRFFPPTEMARISDESQLQALLQQFQELPELRLALLADFQRMQSVKPELVENGQVAVFRLDAGQGRAGRMIKLQKFNGSWRLFDDASRVSQELVRQSQHKMQNAPTSVQFERIGGNWRFVELLLLRTGAQ